MESKLRIDQLKIALLNHNGGKGVVFFSSMLSYLKLKEDPGCGTAWTDGVSVGFDPAFVDKCTTDELLGVFMHEIGHVIFEHCGEPNVNQDVHGIAADHYINLWLPTIGFNLPTWFNFYADSKYRGWGTMKIYADLMKNPPPPPPPPQSGTNLSGDIRAKPGGMTKAEHGEIVKGNLVKAKIAAEMQKEPYERLCER